MCSVLIIIYQMMARFGCSNTLTTQPPTRRVLQDEGTIEILQDINYGFIHKKGNNVEDVVPTLQYFIPGLELNIVLWLEQYMDVLSFLTILHNL